MESTSLLPNKRPKEESPSGVPEMLRRVSVHRLRTQPSAPEHQHSREARHRSRIVPLSPSTPSSATIDFQKWSVNATKAKIMVLPAEVRFNLRCIVFEMDELALDQSAYFSEEIKWQQRRDLVVELLSSALNDHDMELDAAVSRVVAPVSSRRWKVFRQRTLDSKFYKAFLQIVSVLYCLLSFYEEPYSGKWSHAEMKNAAWTEYTEYFILCIFLFHVRFHH